MGIIAVTERLAKEAEDENTSIFFAQLFDKQLLKQRLIMDMFVVSPHYLLLVGAPNCLDRTSKSNQSKLPRRLSEDAKVSHFLSSISLSLWKE